ncbi:leucine-rich repeat domain-containing protein [Jonesiaceae bacterium BS-20]|uniref:Leucine-rich repeat domain-containing protein n=1 Tax=Jonesiaceae bacterium BS-20 TaxID=3120821 RepID=A0AAU7DY71_9MICO
MKHHIRVANPPNPSQSRVRRWPSAYRPRRITGFVAAILLILGGGLATALPAQADTSDPITMPDPALRACINASLGQGDSDPIAAAQADGITVVDCRNLGITDITGLERMPNLDQILLSNNPLTSHTPIRNLAKLRHLDVSHTGVTDADLPDLTGSPVIYYLGLGSNSIADVTELATVSSLTSLYIGNNTITDWSPIASMPNLDILHAANSQITDLTPFQSMTGLTRLYLGANQIVDPTPLANLTNLEVLQLSSQIVDLPSVPLGTATSNPVTDVAGNPVLMTSLDTGFNYDLATNTWTFATSGNKNLEWNTTISAGTVSDVVFTGQIRQHISRADAEPETPEVTQAVCMNGDIAYPQISLPTTEGITYSIEGNVAPGQTVTIKAVLSGDDHSIYVDPASDWVSTSSDHLSAELVILLDDAQCETPAPTVIDAPNGDLPVDDPCGPDNATWRLPTGSDVPDNFTWVITAEGLLTAVANEGYVFSDPTEALDPTLREYGYAPDTNEACPDPDSDTTEDGDKAEETDVKVTDEVEETDVEETVRVQVTGEALAKTGGPDAMVGILTAALLGIGGLLILTGRTRRQQA